jgi:glycosyltransferase involved in cell wall biosynthesis
MSLGSARAPEAVRGPSSGFPDREAGLVRVVVFEPSAAGHRAEYVTHLVVNAPRWNVLPVLVSSAALHGRIASQGAEFAFVQLSSDQLRGCGHPSLVYRSWLRWRVLRDVLEKTGCAHALVMDLDHLQLPLALRRSAGEGRLSGILFRTETHYQGHPCERGPRARLRRWRKDLAYGAMVRNPTLANVFALDEYFVPYATVRYRTSRIHALPDPATFSAESSAGTQLPEAVTAGRVVFVLFGVLAYRKGVMEMLEALERLPGPVARRVTLVLAGEVHDHSTAIAIRAKIEQLRRGGCGAIVYTRFERLPSAVLDAIIRESDVVLVPYQCFPGSSGAVLRSAALGRPLIAQDYGWVGETTRRYRLGRTVDSRSSAALARAMSERVAAERPVDFDEEAARALAAQRTPERFADTVYGHILAHEGR